ncbi:Transposase [Caligus rogercresseyi]|uniref:Transposase n=1 Tax=Caligus rogercresseyi TaxID=217165 RepID=A0A7T8HK62_CALRO|nr:Transposase [Caligus rogercresseyi]
MRLQFQSKTLAAFGIGVEKEYPLIGKRALAILLLFATSYLCEIGFSAVASIKTKYQSWTLRMNSEWQFQNCNTDLTRYAA